MTRVQKCLGSAFNSMDLFWGDAADITPTDTPRAPNRAGSAGIGYSASPTGGPPYGWVSQDHRGWPFSPLRYAFLVLFGSTIID